MVRGPVKDASPRISSTCAFASLFSPALAKAANDGALSLANPPHVDGDWSDIDAIVTAAARQIGHARTGHHGFSWSATAIDTSAADILALDQRSLLSRFGKRPGQGIAALPRADDDGVKTFRHTPPMMQQESNGPRFLPAGDNEKATADSRQVLQ